MECRMKSFRFHGLVLIPLMLLASVVAYCQIGANQYSWGSPTECLAIGPTVAPPLSPSPVLPKRTDLGHPPSTPASCTSPGTPSVSAADALRAPSTNDPPRPAVNASLPSSEHASGPPNTPSMRVR